MLSRRQLLALGALGLPGLARAARRRRWNILLLSSDEHNAGLMGHLHPDARTPALDRLAAEGLSFPHAYAASPICAPARQSLLTGLYPNEHGQYGNEWTVDPGLRTLVHDFAEQGYLTAAFGKMHTHQEKLGFGFQVRDDGWTRVPMPPGEDPAFAGMPDARLTGYALPEGADHPDLAVLRSALGFLEEHGRERFFLYASFLKPHYPFVLPPAFYGRTDPASLHLPPLDESDLDDSPRGLHRFYSEGWVLMSEAQRRLARARYLDSISFMDSLVGQLLDELDRRRLSRKTLVVYLSDHGEMAGDKGLWMKLMMFEGAVRVPLIVRMPGLLPAGERDERLVSQVDILPTLAELVGVQCGPHSGRSLLGEPAQRVFSVAGPNQEERWPRQLMVRDARWKYIRYRRGSQNLATTNELYDLESDPEEHTNLAFVPGHEARITAMEEQGGAFLDGLREPAFPPSRVSRAPGAPPLEDVETDE